MTPASAASLPALFDSLVLNATITATIHNNTEIYYNNHSITATIHNNTQNHIIQQSQYHSCKIVRCSVWAERIALVWRAYMSERRHASRIN